MKEEDVAKLAYAAIVEAVNEFNSGYKEPEFKAEFPDTVTVNGNVYRFEKEPLVRRTADFPIRVSNATEAL